jgi:hypothetical protein
MVVKKATLSFKKLSDSGFLGKSKEVQTSMTGNANFANPDPAMTEVDKAVADYEDAFIAAQNLGRVNVAKKNEARLALTNVLTQLVVYVNFIAKGNVAVLLSSGFVITKDREAKKIGTAGVVTLKNGKSSGELIAAIQSAGNGASYEFNITDLMAGDKTVWISTPSKKSKFTFTNLIQGKQYWVKVAVVGAGNQLSYSDVVSIFVQ